MEIKTIGDLRKLISENAGELIIGDVSFQFGGEDIDVYHHGGLVQWFSKSNKDDTLIAEAENSISSDVEERDKVNEEETKVRRENRQLKEQLETLEKKTNENASAVGKVAAYEKLLVGRAITISA